MGLLGGCGRRVNVEQCFISVVRQLPMGGGRDWRKNFEIDTPFQKYWSKFLICCRVANLLQKIQNQQSNNSIKNRASINLPTFYRH